MKGKKLMAMLMAGSMLLAGLTGCGGANAKGGNAAADAADYPNGPVTIICPWGVGGGADVISRKISEVAKNYFDQPIIVENHTGASGTIGMMDAMDADADGYTMVVTNGPLFSLTPKYIDVSYELSNFTMLRGMRQVALMIFTNPQKSGMKTFDDLINSRAITTRQSTSCILRTAASSSPCSMRRRRRTCAPTKTSACTRAHCMRMWSVRRSSRPGISCITTSARIPRSSRISSSARHPRSFRSRSRPREARRNLCARSSPAISMRIFTMASNLPPEISGSVMIFIRSRTFARFCSNGIWRVSRAESCNFITLYYNQYRKRRNCTRSFSFFHYLFAAL